MHEARLSKKRAAEQTKNMTEERRIKHQETNQVKHMTAESIARQREARQVEHMTAESIARHQEANQVGNMSDKRVHVKREGDRLGQVTMTEQDIREMQDDLKFQTDWEQMNNDVLRMEGLCDDLLLELRELKNSLANDDRLKFLNEQLEEHKPMMAEAYERLKACKLNNAQRRINGCGRVATSFMASLSDVNRTYIENYVDNISKEEGWFKCMRIHFDFFLKQPLLMRTTIML